MIKELVVLSVSLFLVGCSAQMIARGRLNHMKAHDYFDQAVQIELAKAIDADDPSGIDAAIQKGANPNFVGKEEMTPLSWSFSKQKKVSFKHLLERGANPNYKTRKTAWNNEGRSVMQFSALCEDPYYLKQALKHGGDPNAPDVLPDKTILHTAIRHHRLENIKLLAAHGANLNHLDKAGFTPLMHAKFEVQYDVLYLLLKLGADPVVFGMLLAAPQGNKV